MCTTRYVPILITVALGRLEWIWYPYIHAMVVFLVFIQVAAPVAYFAHCTAALFMACNLHTRKVCALVILPVQFVPYRTNRTDRNIDVRYGMVPEYVNRTRRLLS